MEQTVNLSASAFGSSNLPFPTTLLSVHLVVQDTALSLPVHEFEPRTENHTMTLTHAAFEQLRSLAAVCHRNCALARLERVARDGRYSSLENSVKFGGVSPIVEP